MQKIESDYEKREKELQELIEKEMAIYIPELNKFVDVMKSEEDWPIKFDTSKWILSVQEQIATVEKEYPDCICSEAHLVLKDKIGEEFKKEEFAYLLFILETLPIFGLV